METTTINKTEKPNSFSWRWGGPSTEVKVYFDTAESLEKQVLALSESSLKIRESIERFNTAMKSTDGSNNK